MNVACKERKPGRQRMALAKHIFNAVRRGPPEQAVQASYVNGTTAAGDTETAARGIPGGFNGNRMQLMAVV